jgi:hypothetical protein
MVAETTVVPRKPQLMFILVHGTFGRNGDWMKDGKNDSLRAQLKREFERDFEVCFDQVDWGLEGALWKRMPDNTVHYRLEGAALLAERLERLPDVSSTNRRYLVAHSHGGNIAMYALKNRNLLNKVTGIVCLSTPFLNYARVGFHRDLPVLSLFALGMMAYSRGSAFLWVYFAVYLAVVVTLLRSRNLGEDIESIARIDAHATALRIPNRNEVCNAAGEIPFLAVRPRRDEVAALFFITQNAGAIFRALWQFVNTVGRWALWVFVLAAAIRWIRDSRFPQVDLAVLDRLMSLADRLVLTPMALLATVILLGMAIMRWSFAFDSLPWLPRLDVRSTIVPWVGAQAVAVDKFYIFSRHTRVQNQASPKIRNWIRDSHRVDEKDLIR